MRGSRTLYIGALACCISIAPGVLFAETKSVPRAPECTVEGADCTTFTGGEGVCSSGLCFLKPSSERTGEKKAPNPAPATMPVISETEPLEVPEPIANPNSMLESAVNEYMMNRSGTEQPSFVNSGTASDHIENIVNDSQKGPPGMYERVLRSVFGPSPELANPVYLEERLPGEGPNPFERPTFLPYASESSFNVPQLSSPALEPWYQSYINNNGDIPEPTRSVEMSDWPNPPVPPVREEKPFLQQLWEYFNPPRSAPPPVDYRPDSSGEYSTHALLNMTDEQFERVLRERGIGPIEPEPLPKSPEQRIEEVFSALPAPTPEPPRLNPLTAEQTAEFSQLPEMPKEKSFGEQLWEYLFPPLPPVPAKDFQPDERGEYSTYALLNMTDEQFNRVLRERGIIPDAPLPSQTTHDERAENIFTILESRGVPTAPVLQPDLSEFAQVPEPPPRVESPDPITSEVVSPIEPPAVGPIPTKEISDLPTSLPTTQPLPTPVDETPEELPEVRTGPTRNELIEESAQRPALPVKIPSEEQLSSAKNLSDAWRAAGLTLPSQTERAALYRALGNTDRYRGTAAQNIKLLNQLRSYYQ